MAEKARPGSNGYDPEKAKGFFEKIEKEEADIAVINTEAKKSAQPHKDHINQVKKEAAEAGIPKEVMAAKLSSRKHERKMLEATNRLNDQQKEDYKLLTDALGDFANEPLGQAALAQSSNGLDTKSQQAPA